MLLVKAAQKLILIKSLKIVDRVLGPFLCVFLGRPNLKSLNCLSRILFIRPGGIGDAALLSPSIVFIKNKYPNIHITVLAERRNLGVFSLVPSVDTVLCYDRPKDLVSALLSRFDVIIDTEQWFHLSALVARLIRASVKIGFDTNERNRMFTHLAQYSQTEYEVLSFKHLLSPLVDNQLGNSDVRFLTIPGSISEIVARQLEPLEDIPFVTIFHGASTTEKRWAPKQFNAVVKQLINYGYRIVVVGGLEDRADGEYIAGVGGLNLAGMTTLTETAAVISKSSLLISGDSGVLHIAVGLGIPTVSLFGPSSKDKWAPKGENHIVLSSNLPCSPCSKFGTTPPCPHNVRCMKEITADQVVEAAVTLLQKYSNKNQD